MEPVDLSVLLSAAPDDARDQQVLLELLQQAAHRALARERTSSLETGDLANDVYLRLSTGQGLQVADELHLRRLVARVTRNVLVDRARQRRSDKRGGAAVRVTYTERKLADDGVDVDVLTLHDLLGRLEQLDARTAEIVQLRVFGGVTAQETASALGLSRATVQSEWAFALTWLRKQLSDSD